MKIGTAKIRVINKNPFFGTLLYHLPVIIDDKVTETLAVDGENLYVNLGFWNKLDSSKQMGVLMHEVAHLFLNHIFRGKKFRDVLINPETGQVLSLWNYATDVVVNEMILTDGRFDLPDGHIRERKYNGWSAEAVYHDLKKNTKEFSGKDIQKMIDSQFSDKSKWGTKTYESKDESEEEGEARTKLEDKWREISKQAIEVAKQKGNLPSYLAREYEKLQPKEDWRSLLIDYAQPFNNDYSFNPCDRRFLDEEFILPDIVDGHKIDWIAIAIDTSGSISQKELASFIGEVKGIMESFDSIKVKLTFCDCQASKFIKLTNFSEDSDLIKPTGFGGTDFKPVFDLIKKEESEPLALLYFTDLMGDFPNKKPDYDVLWINSLSDERVKVPFGKTLFYKID